MRACTPQLSVIVPTHRPDHVAACLRMVAAQTYRPVELVLVLHRHAPASLPAEARRACDELGARIVPAPATFTLGECLNAGIAASQGEVIARVDDDDVYAPAYLAEAMDAYLAGKGDVIGKAEQYIYFAASRELVLRFPGGSQGEGQSYLAGATLLFSRELGLDPGFRPLQVNEDMAFLDDCLAVGLRLYATSRRHFVRRRYGGTHHTWAPEEAFFREGSLTVRRGVEDDSPAGLISLVSGA
jgi:glycosyltransferase involved in cell wall biosynthesis